MGTTPSGLTDDSHAALTEAANNGTLVTLPKDLRTALVKAVQDGDNTTVQAITSATEQGRRVDIATLNKAKVLLNYAKENGVDLENATSAERQAIGEQAIAHSLKTGTWQQLGNKTGAYRGGYSDDTLAAIRQLGAQ